MSQAVNRHVRLLLVLLATVGLTSTRTALAQPAAPPPATTAAPVIPAGDRFEAALDDTSATLRGTHFVLHWSTWAGGDLTSILIHDGASWNELLGRGRVRQSVPGLRLVTGAGDYRALGGAGLRWLEQGPERAVLEVETRPTTVDGTVSDIRVRQLYTIYPEGAVFTDLEIELPDGAAAIELERASIGWPVDVDAYSLRRWHWRRSVDRSGFYLEPERQFRASPCPELGIALGHGTEFTNQVQFVLEGSEPLGDAEQRTGALVADGSYLIFHLRPGAAGATRLTAPFRYSNRWGILLGRAPEYDPLRRQRLVYWQEGGESAMAYPSPGALEAMVQCGASGVVLGPGWRRAGGADGNVPIDADAMGEMIGTAHAMGLAVIAYTTAQGDPDELAAWTRDMQLDGLFVDQTSPHHWPVAGGEQSYPARATFEWGHRLRQELGSASLLLGRSGVAGPDLTMALNLHGVVFGTEPGDMKASSKSVLAAYLGGQGFGIPCPLPEEMRLRTTRSLAHYAAIGAVPLTPLGWGEERSAYRAAQWVLPLWQIYRALPSGAAVRSRRGERGLVSSSNPRFRTMLYQDSADAVLVLSANLSTARYDSTALELHYDAVGMDGAYAVEEIRGLELDAFESLYLGRSVDGRVATPPIARWGLRGHLFVRGDYPAAVGRSLDEIAQLARAYGDRTPPSTPPAPEVRADRLALQVSWEPAGDRHHVEAYRIYRSPTLDFDPDAVEDLGLVYETTEFRDLTAAPGVDHHYAVAAVDQAGNEGAPSPSASGRLPAADLVLDFTDPAEAGRLEVLTGSWALYEGGFEHGRTPDATRFARALLTDAGYSDVDFSVRIESPGGYRYSGGLLFRADERGDGYVLFLGDPQKSRLVLARLEGDEVHRIAESVYPYVTRGEYRRTLRVVARGSRIVGSCDGQVLIDVEDTGRSGDRVGLTATLGHVRFDTISLARPAAERP